MIHFEDAENKPLIFYNKNVKPGALPTEFNLEESEKIKYSDKWS